jgi:PST family polysaccharide transporter
MSGILNTCCTVIGFFIAAYWGNSIEAVAWSWDITLAINFINTYFIMHIFTLKESPISYYKSLLPQLINSVLTLMIVGLIVDSIHGLGVIASLLCKLILISLCTIVFATLLKQYSIKDIAKMSHVFHKR